MVCKFDRIENNFPLLCKNIYCLLLLIYTSTKVFQIVWFPPLKYLVNWLACFVFLFPIVAILTISSGLVISECYYETQPRWLIRHNLMASILMSTTRTYKPLLKSHCRKIHLQIVCLSCWRSTVTMEQSNAVAAWNITHLSLVRCIQNKYCDSVVNLCLWHTICNSQKQL